METMTIVTGCYSECAGSTPEVSGGGEEACNNICNSHFYEDTVTSSNSLIDIANTIAVMRGALNLTSTIHFDGEFHELKGCAKFNNTRSIRIHGENSQLVCSGNESGLEFRSVENILIENVTVMNCGFSLYIRSTSIRSAIQILNCGQVTITGVKIANSDGNGLNIQRNKGDVSITHSYFLNNTQQDNEDEVILGGNGVILYITANTYHVYEFINCMFMNNSASGVTYGFILSDNNGMPLPGTGRGGGMIVTFKNTRDVRVIISSCQFVNNHAFIGGGLSVEIEGGIDNQLMINDTKFIRNGCIEGNNSVGNGGGIHLSFERIWRGMAKNNSMIIYNSTFDSNCAKLGGGTYFFSGKSMIHDINNSITFDKCNWTENFAHTGSAAYVSPNIFTRSRLGFLPEPVFRDCSFIKNRVKTEDSIRNYRHKENRQYGFGTLYSSLVNIKFKSSAEFKNNFGSGIIIVNGVADFEDSNATFIENIGVQGGAIALIGIASMVVGGGQSYLFERNRAYDRGGAIYSYLVDMTDFTVSRSCFIQYRDRRRRSRNYIVPTEQWNTTLTFDNNIASQFGHSIYTTSILPCQVVSNGMGRYKVIDRKDIFRDPGIVIVNDTKEKHIATEGTNFEFKHKSEKLMPIPGEEFDLGLRILDDLNQEVDATLIAYIRQKRSSSLMVETAFSCITNKTVKFSGKEGEEGNMVLQTLGSRKHSVNLNVQLRHCPPGFRLDDTIARCMCDANAYVGLTACINYTAFLTPGFWAGYINATQGKRELATSICPYAFCNYNRTDRFIFLYNVELPSSDLEEAICGRKRRGVLCGECRKGFTVYYHSPSLICDLPQLDSCNYGWALYILSELVPVTIIFLVVLVLNLSLTGGAVNGFILFSQLLDTLLIDASGVITFPEPIKILSRGYQIIYGFFNLDLFAVDSLSFCIWENASVLDMLSFKYITVAYSLLLVVSVILFMKYYAAKCLGRYYSITSVRNSVIHGLTGFLVLCYGQCIKISFSILYRRDIILRHRANSNQYQLSRVWLNGNVEYFSSKHLLYAIPAIFILVIIGVIPPLLLIGHPLLNKAFIYFKFENSRVVRYLNKMSKLKPLLDSFQGSFKDDLRFFAGVYFFYRWIAVITYATITSLSLFYSITQALLILILIVHSVFQPYQKRWHNILDSFLIADLNIINGISAALYYVVRVDSGKRTNELDRRIAISGSIQLVLIYLPLAYITLYVATYVTGKMFCKDIKEVPTSDEFVLKKIGKRIYHSSFSGSDISASIEENLPYRLLGKEDDNPFESSLKENDDITDTY